MTHFQKRKVNLRFVYCFCGEVGRIRDFYTDILGMSELGFMDREEFGWVGYDSEGMQLMFFRWDESLPERKGWAWQPGDGAGDLPVLSFSLELPADECRTVIRDLREAGCEAMTGAPTWRQDSYWGWTVRDPAGNTVELYWHPDVRPEGDPPVWTGD